MEYQQNAPVSMLNTCNEIIQMRAVVLADGYFSKIWIGVNRVPEASDFPPFWLRQRSPSPPPHLTRNERPLKGTRGVVTLIICARPTKWLSCRFQRADVEAEESTKADHHEKKNVHWSAA